MTIFITEGMSKDEKIFQLETQNEDVCGRFYFY